MYSKTYVKELLFKGICVIKFRKINGDVRQCRGTTSPEHLGEFVGHPKQDFDVNDNQIKFYDIDEKHWKSFLIQKLEFISPISIQSDQTLGSDENYLYIEGKKYSLEKIEEYISLRIGINSLATWNKIIEHFKGPTVEDWKQAVANDETTASFEEWKENQQSA